MKLAINGGKAIRTKSFPTRQLYNKRQVAENIAEVIDSNNLSGYRGSFGQHFWGGKYVRMVEEQFEEFLYNNSELKTKYYVLAVNSCTSALQIACGAIGLKELDEVIVTPWSMTCSATAPMIYNARPIFADIEKDNFCLDPDSIKENITELTKAIIVVNLFGQPYDVDKISKIAKKYNLLVIEDSAQALGSTYKGNQAGTLGDIACFSFTQGKHLTCGEGGFIVTKDAELYHKCALIRNHAEAVINSAPSKYQSQFSKAKNMYGFNMRMTELQAAVLLPQIYNIEKEVNDRQHIVKELKDRIKIEGITFADPRPEATHSYYVLPFLFNEDKIGINRNKFIEALKAELTVSKTEMGITTIEPALIWPGYIKPIYKMPLFDANFKYYKVNLPTVEILQEVMLGLTSYQALKLEEEDLKDICDAFYKVYENIKELKGEDNDKISC